MINNYDNDNNNNNATTNNNNNNTVTPDDRGRPREVEQDQLLADLARGNNT